MLLTIIVPTYNRSTELERNIYLLNDLINRNDLVGIVSVLISDNCSTDATSDVLEKIKCNDNFFIYTQTKNIGLEKNAIFVLQKSTSDYVMYLGDDDYIDELYLMGVISRLKNDKSLSCIIPSFIGITPSGIEINNCGRDLGLTSRNYYKGFASCLENSSRGHQLSGLVLKRAGLLDAYINNKVCNLYPFIFFVAYSALHGDIWHFPEHPVKVTQPGQEKKDWGYKDDGLISEIFDNYAKLPGLTIKQRHQLEIKFLKDQPWRFMMYRYRSFLAAYKIIRHENTSLMTKFSMFYLYPQQVSIIILRFIKRNIFS